MAKQLSSYWVKFFTSAGFPLEVATKHALVFSNNRIKPDMLPDLDKPSLKEMGITLMGDMIAILRYAKKVSEEMTCEKFLVESKEILAPARPLKVAKPIVRKSTVISKMATVTRPVAAKVLIKEPVKPLRVTSSVPTDSPQKRKFTSAAVPQEPQAKKRKIMTNVVEIDSDSQEEWTTQMQKRLKASGNGAIVHKTGARSPGKIDSVKKAFEQKRTVFDRLGDSAVTSTTNPTVVDSSTTFNVTGLGDVLRRNSSVFNRLGDKDGKREDKSAGILRNGITGSNGQLQGILKSRGSNLKGTMVKLKLTPSAGRIGGGTMHADHEEGKTSVSTSVKQLVKTTKAIQYGGQKTVERRINITSKLASESGAVPAKARLGTTAPKQVTFNRIATVKHIKKSGVFSRLGI